MRDGENEAFVVDRYLESLLNRRPADATDLAPELLSTASAIAAALPRYHPSFRFEEALALRLATAAAAGRLDTSPEDVPGAGRGGTPAGAVIPFPRPSDIVIARDDRPAAMRPAVIGGVLTSAAISLAGAAYVAWRMTRPPADPMARAIRAAARRRTA